jgi:hypothetical protein
MYSFQPNDQNHPAAASGLEKCEKRTTAARVHFIVLPFIGMS